MQYQPSSVRQSSLPLTFLTTFLLNPSHSFLPFVLSSGSLNFFRYNRTNTRSYALDLLVEIMTILE